MMVFQQMAVKCLMPFPNLHKVLFGLARMSVTCHGTGVQWLDEGQVGLEKANRNPVLKGWIPRQMDQVSRGGQIWWHLCLTLFKASITFGIKSKHFMFTKSLDHAPTLSPHFIKAPTHHESPPGPQASYLILANSKPIPASLLLFACGCSSPELYSAFSLLPQVPEQRHMPSFLKP